MRRAVYLMPDRMQRDRDSKWTRDDASKRPPSIIYFLQLDPFKLYTASPKYHFQQGNRAFTYEIIWGRCFIPKR